ncbi:MAG: HAMP domain-containing sensor histidine kinase [Actinomycetota bacterium]|nr:HAMP domain-containing sensor histidine kinase [Actinomycetota bacterium]
MRARQPRLATRLMVAQAIVVSVGAVTMVIAAALVAPVLFHDHLVHAGVTEPGVQLHAEEAFASSFAISVAVATLTSLAAAFVVSLFLVRRVSRPVEELAHSAQEVAVGRYDVDVPDATFSRELQQLSGSFSYMADRLAEFEATRIRLLADLAHEIRTPLATLEAYIDGMEDAMLPVEASSWATMRTQVMRLRRLSGDLREVAAAEEHALGLALERIDARSVSSSAVAAALPRYHAKGVSLAEEHPAQPCWISGDDVRLQQVLANLLDNALRHTQAGGTVRVVTRSTQARVSISVTDSGEGIPPEQLSSIFERFHRVDRSRTSNDGSGSGLGLTIARAIVMDHDGALTARSDGQGHGSSFTVELPARP